jgi:hypothetical protein
MNRNANSDVTFGGGGVIFFLVGGGGFPFARRLMPKAE